MEFDINSLNIVASYREHPIKFSIQLNYNWYIFEIYIIIFLSYIQRCKITRHIISTLLQSSFGAMTTYLSKGPFFNILNRKSWGPFRFTWALLGLSTQEGKKPNKNKNKRHFPKRKLKIKRNAQRFQTPRIFSFFFDKP